MSTPYAPVTRGKILLSTAPTLVTGYPRIDPVDGRWYWSFDPPADAGVITDTDGLITVETGVPGTWDVILSENGSPILY